MPTLPSEPIRPLARGSKLSVFMTVCIAAVSTILQRIVTVSDQMLSDPYSSFDSAVVKSRFLTPDFRWACMFSCATSARFAAIYERAARYLRMHEPPVPCSAVVAAIEAAYSDERRRMAEIHVLSPLRMSFDDFEATGAKQLGQNAFQEMLAKMATLDTGVELLVMGFDEEDAPRLLMVSAVGDVSSCDTERFAAVGSGANVALDYLKGNTDFRNSDDLGEIIYRICEAKFTAEMSQGVGSETTVLSIGPNGNATAHAGSGIRRARKLWRSRRKAPIPASLRAELERGIVDIDPAGASVVNMLRAMYVQSSNLYESTMARLVSGRALGLVDNAKWSRVERIQKSIAERAPQIQQALGAVGAAAPSPNAVEAVTIRILALVKQVNELSLIATRAASGARETSGSERPAPSS